MKINPLNIISFVQSIGIQQKTDDNANSSNNPQSLITPKTSANKDFNFNMEGKFNNINYYQQLMLIKDLLKLPKEWLDLMNLSLSSSKEIKNINELLSLAEVIDVKDLILFIQSNSKEALSKLLKLTSTSPDNFQNISQLKELVSLLNKLTPENNTPFNQLLNNIIPLYVPFTAAMQNTQTLQEFQEESDPKKTQDLALMAFLTSENLGRFKIYVYKKPIGLECLIENNYKEQTTQNYVKILCQNIKKEAGLKDIEVNFNEQKVKKEEKREIYIKQINSPACDVLTAAFIIIKLLFALDEKITLLENRKAKIQ